MLLTSFVQTLSVIATVIYIVSIIFLIAEVFIPGFGFFGISGITGLVVSIIVKICINVSVERILLEIVIALVIIIAILVWIIISARKGIISKSPLISQGSSIPTFYNDDELKVFISSEGKTVTTCKPVGKIRIENEIYDASSLDGYLDVDTPIRVVSVKDNILEIEKIKEGN